MPACLLPLVLKIIQAGSIQIMEIISRAIESIFVVEKKEY